MLLDEGIAILEKHNGIRITETLSKWSKFRALMNITNPTGLDEHYYEIQDEIIQNEYKEKEIVDALTLPTRQDNIALWKGDITCIKADAIVNAANPQMLGCFIPLHSCIDSLIMTYAGLQVRRDLMEIMKERGKDEPNGTCTVTAGYNLPAKYIFHTVGPNISSLPSLKDEEDLKNCYLSCLKKADELGLKSLVFCCISTRVYGYPKKEAAEIAVSAVINFLRLPGPKVKVLFDVYTPEDYQIYDKLLLKEEEENIEGLF